MTAPAHRSGDDPEISFVVPLLDEEESLEPLHDRIREVCESRSMPFEVIYVDDGSTDGSLARLEGLAETFQRLFRTREARARRALSIGAAPVTTGGSDRSARGQRAQYRNTAIQRQCQAGASSWPLAGRRIQRSLEHPQRSGRDPRECSLATQG